MSKEAMQTRTTTTQLILTIILTQTHDQIIIVLIPISPTSIIKMKAPPTSIRTKVPHTIIMGASIIVVIGETKINK